MPPKDRLAYEYLVCFLTGFSTLAVAAPHRTRFGTQRRRRSHRHLLAQLPWFTQHGLGALALAIVLGLLLGNTVYPRWAHTTTPGVALSKQQLLRTGIVLYGLRLTFQDIGQVGWAGVALDALVLASTFGLACILGLRVFGLDKRTTWLIGAGSSICGAAAVLATAPVAKGRAQDVAVAIATVVVFGTLGTFLYPALYQWNAAHGWLRGCPAVRPVCGATVHEVAQVVAAGAAVSPEATNTAVDRQDGARDDAGPLLAAAFGSAGAQPAPRRRRRRAMQLASAFPGSLWDLWPWQASIRWASCPTP